VLTPAEAGALEPLAPPPVQGLWEGLAGSTAPIDLGAPLSALVRPLGRSGGANARVLACPRTLSQRSWWQWVGHVPARWCAGQSPHAQLVVAVLAT